MSRNLIRENNKMFKENIYENEVVGKNEFNHHWLY